MAGVSFAYSRLVCTVCVCVGRAKREVSQCASRDDILEFARETGNDASFQPVILLLIAAASQRWSIVHKMVESGINPNSAPPTDLYNDCLPWIMSVLSENLESFNSNMLLVIAAYKGDLTVLRYLMRQRKTLGIDSLGLICIPAIRMYQEQFDDGFWLLQNMPFKKRDFADACGHMLNVIVNGKFSYARRRLVTVMRRRGAYSYDLLSTYATLPQVMQMRHENFTLDPKTAMVLKIPPADMEAVRSFAHDRRIYNSDDLPHVLLVAALYKNWNIVHFLLDLGLNPQDSRANPRCPELEPVSDHLEHREWGHSNIMLSVTAEAGNATALRYMLSLQNQIKYTRFVHTWLPMVAERGNASALALWLLDTLALNDDEYERAMIRTIVAASTSRNMNLMALLLKRLSRRAGSVDLVTVVEQMLLPVLHNEDIVKCYLFDTWLPMEVLVAGAKRAQTVAASTPCRCSYMVIQQFIELRLYNSSRAYQQEIVNFIYSYAADHMQTLISGILQMDQHRNILHYALYVAAAKGYIPTMNILLVTKPSIDIVLKNHLNDLLMAASKSQNPKALLLMNKHAPREDPGFYVAAVKRLMIHVLAESRVKDILPLLRAETSGPQSDDVLSMAAIISAKYGMSNELRVILPVVVTGLSSALMSTMISTAIDEAAGTTGDIIEKYTMLLDAAKQNPATYLLALRQCMIVGARNDSMGIISFVNLLGEWRSQDERQAALVLAAETACKFGNAKVLENLLMLAVEVPPEVRMRWEFHANTWKIVLDGIPNERLLAAQIVAAETENGPNYVLVRNGLHASRPTDAQLAASQQADDLRAAYQTRRQRRQNVVEESELEIIADQLPIGLEECIYILAERCAICFDQLVSPAAHQAGPPLMLTESSEDITTETVPKIQADSVFHIVPDATTVVADEDSTVATFGQPETASVWLQMPDVSEPAEPIMRLHCSGRHLFHRTCILEWFKRSVLCPMCKHDFRSRLGKVAEDR